MIQCTNAPNAPKFILTGHKILTNFYKSWELVRIGGKDYPYRGDLTAYPYHFTLTGFIRNALRLFLALPCLALPRLPRWEQQQDRGNFFQNFISCAPCLAHMKNADNQNTTNTPQNLKVSTAMLLTYILKTKIWSKFFNLVELWWRKKFKRLNS